MKCFAATNTRIDNIVNVTGGQGGNAFLVLGAEKTAVIDCGMAYCASKLIDNIKQVLKERPLSYILISHSHYDHIGAISYIRARWPEVKVLGADYAKQILTRQSALTTIRSLGIQAAKFYGAAGINDYDDKWLKVDHSICDGDIIELGGLSIKVIKTTGHTKCSLSFLVNNEILFASESTGYMSKLGKIYPAFITSSAEAIDSIALCPKINPNFIISPHYGLLNQADTRTYWENCSLSVKATKDFILNLASRGYDEEQILIEYESDFRDEQSRLEQPNTAFILNTQFMIKTVLKER